MPRPREHDSDEVRYATYRCFWQKGFSRTSLADLRQATGMDPRQFLRDYGNKKGVFLQALRDFSEAAALHTLDGLENGKSGISDIRRTLVGLVELGGEEGGWGCLICTTAQDREAMADEEVAILVRAYLSRIEKAYRLALRRAVLDGELSADASGERRHARALMAAHVAIMMLKRSKFETGVVRDIARQAVDALK